MLVRLFDSFGGVGVSSLKLMNKIISKTAQRSEHTVEASQYYWKRLSLALERAVGRQLVLLIDGNLANLLLHQRRFELD